MAPPGGHTIFCRKDLRDARCSLCLSRTLHVWRASRVCDHRKEKKRHSEKPKRRQAIFLFQRATPTKANSCCLFGRSQDRAPRAVEPGMMKRHEKKMQIMLERRRARNGNVRNREIRGENERENYFFFFFCTLDFCSLFASALAFGDGRTAFGAELISSSTLSVRLFIAVF